MSLQVADVAAISPEPAFRVRRHALAHIPGDEGWPVIGRTLHILADPKGEVERMAAKYGLVYRTRVLGETGLSLLGPEANEFVLSDQTKLFSSTHGWRRSADRTRLQANSLVSGNFTGNFAILGLVSVANLVLLGVDRESDDDRVQ